MSRPTLAMAMKMARPMTFNMDPKRRLLLARLAGGGLCFLWLAAVLILQPVFPGPGTRAAAASDGATNVVEQTVVTDQPDAVVEQAVVASEPAAAQPATSEATPAAVAEIATVAEPAVAEQRVTIVEALAAASDATDVTAQASPTERTLAVDAATADQPDVEGAVAPRVSASAPVANGYTWQHVQRADGAAGWVAGEYLNHSTVATGGPVLMLRTAPTTSAPALGVIANGAHVTLG